MLCRIGERKDLDGDCFCVLHPDKISLSVGKGDAEDSRRESEQKQRSKLQKQACTSTLSPPSSAACGGKRKAHVENFAMIMY